MPSKRTEPRSIASQLVLWFTLAASLLFSCGLGALYLIVVRHAFEEDNEFLADKLFALRADLNKSDWSTIPNEEFKALRTGEHSVYWVRVVDPAGQTVAETPTMNSLLPPDVFPPALKLNSSGRTPPVDYHVRGKLFSLLSS